MAPNGHAFSKSAKMFSIKNKNRKIDNSLSYKHIFPHKIRCQCDFSGINRPKPVFARAGPYASHFVFQTRQNVFHRKRNRGNRKPSTQTTQKRLRRRSPRFSARVPFLSHLMQKDRNYHFSFMRSPLRKNAVSVKIAPQVWCKDPYLKNPTMGTQNARMPLEVLFLTKRRETNPTHLQLDPLPSIFLVCPFFTPGSAPRRLPSFSSRFSACRMLPGSLAVSTRAKFPGRIKLLLKFMAPMICSATMSPPL